MDSVLIWCLFPEHFVLEDNFLKLLNLEGGTDWNYDFVICCGQSFQGNLYSRQSFQGNLEDRGSVSLQRSWKGLDRLIAH